MAGIKGDSLQRLFFQNQHEVLVCPWGYTQEMGEQETEEGSDVYHFTKGKPHTKGKSVPFRDQKQFRSG